MPVNGKLGFLFKVSLFIGCLAFVSRRGYRSFQKYLSNEEAIDIQFEFVGRLTFPSISICPSDVRWKKTHKDVLDECSMKSSDYLSKGIWIGTGSENCTDPKKLALRLRKFSQMRIKGVEIKTYEDNTYPFIMEEIKSLKWDYSPLTFTNRCFTLKMPEYMVAEGSITCKQDQTCCLVLFCQQHDKWNALLS